MVTFSCDGCCEILSKRKVDRHMLNCRNFPSVSCVDCNMTFEGDNYKVHTSCVSEAERYKISTLKKSLTTTSKKISKPLVQEAWMELIKISLPAAPDLLKPFLHKLMNYDNVPRKEKEFVNFVRNSLKIRNSNPDTVIESLWNYLYIMKKESFGILSNTFQIFLESDAEGDKKDIYTETRRYIPSYSSSENITSDNGEETKNISKQTITKKMPNYDKVSENIVCDNEEEEIHNATQKMTRKELSYYENFIDNNTSSNGMRNIPFKHSEDNNNVSSKETGHVSKSNVNEIRDGKYITHNITVTKKHKLKPKTTIKHCNDTSEIIFMELLKSFSKTTAKKVKLKVIQRAINKKLKITDQHCPKKEIINYITVSNKNVWVLDKKKKNIFLV